ncbi:MAG: DUF1489 domain-containing protein [Alphaproteobacteria bacterium]|nr:DUF1489 domain-containing protein [Alphaproteobacteria bacterium]
MTLHLIKLSVGPESLADLASWQKKRLKVVPELIHITRQTPKRAAELLDGGSIYWVIGGHVVARQKLLELRPMERDGIPHCGLVYDKQMITVEMRPRRPFQGWRYLEEKDAPPDLPSGAEDDSLPSKLRALGLL